MSRKSGLISSIALIALLGCSNQVAHNSPSAPVESPSQFTRIFTYSGRGERPTFENDKNKKIEFVEVGQRGVTVHGEDFTGGGGTDVTYEGGKIGFSDRSSQTFRTITTGTSMNGTFSWVIGR